MNDSSVNGAVDLCDQRTDKENVNLQGKKESEEVWPGETLK